MNESRYAIKVGLFAAVGLALIAFLLMSFAKGFSFFTPTYPIHLKANSVGGLKKNANVLLSGVPIGKVTGFDVAPEGRGVLIHLSIEEKYKDRLRADAHFAIEQLGLLGDQYVEITPQANQAPPLQPGQTVTAEDPLSIQGTARSAKGLLEQASITLKNINEVISRADSTVLSSQSLSNIAQSMENFRLISARASVIADNIDKVIIANTPAIAGSVSNLARFTQEMGILSAEVQQILSTNRIELNSAVKNLQNTSENLERMVKEVDSGEGFAGLVLKDPQFRADMANVASNLQYFSRSLNEHGLFRNLFFKPKVPKDSKTPPKKR